MEGSSPVVSLEEHLPPPTPHLLHPLTLQPCFSPSSFVTKTKALLSLSCWLPWQQTSTHTQQAPPHPPPLPLFTFPSLGSKWVGKRPTSAATVPFGAKL